MKTLTNIGFWIISSLLGLIIQIILFISVIEYFPFEKIAFALAFIQFGFIILTIMSLLSNLGKHTADGINKWLGE